MVEVEAVEVEAEVDMGIHKLDAQQVGKEGLHSKEVDGKGDYE